jgi:hypothetical protein
MVRLDDSVAFIPYEQTYAVVFSDQIVFYDRFAVFEQHYTVAFIFGDFIFGDIRNGRNANDAIIVFNDVVSHYPSISPFNNEYSFTTSSRNLILHNYCVDRVRSSKRNVGLDVIRNVVFFNHGTTRLH